MVTVGSKLSILDTKVHSMGQVVEAKLQALTLGRASVSVPQPHFKWEDGSRSNSAGTQADDEDQPQAERPPAGDDAYGFGHAPVRARSMCSLYVNLSRACFSFRPARQSSIGGALRRPRR